MSKVRILAVQTYDPILISTHEILPIKNLTISDCCSDKFCYVFRRIPTLQYLNVQHIYKNHLPIYGNNSFTGDYTVYLKQLTINDFIGQFDDLIPLLKQTSNLKNLIIFAKNNSDMIDVCQWEHLITSLFPRLIIFKFIFSSCLEDDILYKFQKFQCAFWQE
jgi:hypothetical protein